MRTCHRHYPGRFAGACSHFPPIDSGLPSETVRLAPTIILSGPAQRSLILWPAHSPSRQATLRSKAPVGRIGISGRHLALLMRWLFGGVLLFQLRQVLAHGWFACAPSPNCSRGIRLPLLALASTKLHRPTGCFLAPVRLPDNVTQSLQSMVDRSRYIALFQSLHAQTQSGCASRPAAADGSRKLDLPDRSSRKTLPNDRVTPS
jgi:hypothetical protein